METTPALSQSIRKWTLKNAHDYKLAIPGKVIARVLAEFPDLRGQSKELMALVIEECRRVNDLAPEASDNEYKQFTFEEKKKEEEGEKKLTLANAVMGQVVTRFPPEPSGFPHIGHAKAAFLNYEAARQYGGRMILRMDDTNPEKEKEEFVTAITDGLKWLGIEWSGEITYTSDYMDKLYECADELILKQRAYVCTCSAEAVKKGREKGEECLCRAKFPEESVHEFRKMMAGKYGEGEAVLRFKGNMKSENTTLRDPTLFRVINAPHYRQGDKYKCWPSYDFAAPIIDSLEGVTHAMRSKEYELREGLYKLMTHFLEMRTPELVHFSRLEIKGAPVSKRLITPMIEAGQVSGYDDPRLPTLAGLKRRGIRPEAIRSFVLQFGLTKVESEPGWDKLLSENRKLIDGTSPRRFFCANPAKLELEGAVPKAVSLKNHPQNTAMGTREILASSPVYIPGKDAGELTDGETFRLKDWCNVKLTGRREEEMALPDGSTGKALVLTASFVSDEGDVARKVQWVTDLAKTPAKLSVIGDLLVDGKYSPESMQTLWGWAERSVGDMEAGQTLQLERLCFAVLDSKAEGRVSLIQIST
ncbi:MAG: glutamate--tRNA ligase [Candidatus Micrarchaeota archaeon]|nr:glutamate--tRNA ligase [Candidatus Micrarchaeota archaeon]